jgi:hypothetical protein
MKYYSFQIILINGKAFDSAVRRLGIYWDLQALAGSAYWFTEFTPIRFLSLRLMFDLLQQLFDL